MALSDVPIELVTRCQRGDQTAFEELVARIGPELYAMIYAHVRDHDDTDEILQECLFRLYKHLPSLRDVMKFGSWVSRMAVNQCYSQRLRRSRKAMESTDDQIEWAERDVMWQKRDPDNPRKELMRREVREEINQAIRELPPRQRSVVVLFEVEGRSIREIAEMLNCSVGAVKFNLHQARKKLKLALREYVRQRPSERPAAEAEAEAL